MLASTTSRPSVSVSHLRARLVLAAGFGGLAAAVLGCAGFAAGLALGDDDADACAPDGLDVGQLAPRDRAFAARRLLACSDLTHGRITPEDYRARITAIDAAWGVGAGTAGAMIAEPPIQWATAVHGASSEYSKTSWSVREVLGPPDVYPAHGDLAHAWASRGADDQAEWIEVGYASPTPINAVEVYETFNPGAIDRIELITPTGEVIEASTGAAAARGQTSRVHRVAFACTDQPVAAVRIHLDSQAVPGWNELDAIGVVPCQP